MLKYYMILPCTRRGFKGSYLPIKMRLIQECLQVSYLVRSVSRYNALLNPSKDGSHCFIYLIVLRSGRTMKPIYQFRYIEA